MGGSNDQVIGYKFYVGLHMVTCFGPIDSVEAIRVGDRDLGITPVTSSSSITINKEDLFGGEKGQGGVSGTLDIAFGEPTQTANSYLTGVLGSPVPAFRGVVSFICNRMYLAAFNPYIKKWTFKLKRTSIRSDGSSQWQPTLANISGNMNPAHIIRECFTDQNWGMRYPETAIDETSFAAAAQTLYDESFGLSFYWTREVEVGDMVGLINKYIDGATYLDSVTGKIVLKLIRDDYTAATLPIYDESSIQDVESFKNRSFGETVNELVVKYTDVSDYGLEKTVTVQDLGNITMQGGIVSSKKDFPGITSVALAARVAQRELFAVSAPIATLRFKVDRSAWDLNISDPFKFSWEDYEIAEMIFRVTSVDLGNIDAGFITVSAIQDVFALESTSYIAQQSSLWTVPNTAPADLSIYKLDSASYWSIAQLLTPADLDYLDPNVAFLHAIAASSANDLLSYDLMTSPDTANTYTKTGVGYNCPTATLAAAITSKIATSFTYENDLNDDFVEAGNRNFLIINDEWMEIQDINTTTKTVTVGRGVADTVPATHALGDRIWFAYDDSGYEYQNIERLDNEAIDVKLLSVTTLGTLALASATKRDITLNERIQAPLTPRYFRAGDTGSETHYGATYSTDSITLIWAGRNRLLEIADLIPDDTASSTTEETNHNYVLVIKNQSDVTRVSTSIAAPTRTYTYDNSVNQDTQLKITLSSERDGVNSIYQIDHIMDKV